MVDLEATRIATKGLVKTQEQADRYARRKQGLDYDPTKDTERFNRLKPQFERNDLMKTNDLDFIMDFLMN